MSIPIYLDIETIPSQRPDVRGRLLEEHVRAAREAEPPGNYRKAESIDRWREEQIEHAEDKAEAAWLKTGLDGGYGEIVCIGWAGEDIDTPVHTALSQRIGDAKSERDLLAIFWSDIADYTRGMRVVWIGHCVGFDLRFLHHRSVICNVRPTVHLPYNDTQWRGSYVDTMYEWSGARDAVKLTTLCDMLSIDTPQDDISGADVWEAWQEGRHEDIERHCALDVERVRQIYRRLRWE